MARTCLAFALELGTRRIHARNSCQQRPDECAGLLADRPQGHAPEALGFQRGCSDLHQGAAGDGAVRRPLSWLLPQPNCESPMTAATTASASTTTSGVFEAASHLRTTATRAFQQLIGDIEAGLEELQGALQAETRQHPVRSMLVAAGVGYVLGGGIARPLTRQFARVALRALLAPALDEPGA